MDQWVTQGGSDLLPLEEEHCTVVEVTEEDIQNSVKFVPSLSAVVRNPDHHHHHPCWICEDASASTYESCIMWAFISGRVEAFVPELPEDSWASALAPSHVRDKYPKTRRAFQPSKQSFILGGRTNVTTYKYKLRVVKDKLFSVFIVQSWWSLLDEK